MLLKFQRSYEANAKFFQVTDQTLDTLMGLVRS
jgi:flagellar hook-associated protein FlgK